MDIRFAEAPKIRNLWSFAHGSVPGFDDQILMPGKLAIIGVLNFACASTIGCLKRTLDAFAPLPL